MLFGLLLGTQALGQESTQAGSADKQNPASSESGAKKFVLESSIEKDGSRGPLRLRQLNPKNKRRVPKTMLVKFDLDKNGTLEATELKQAKEAMQEHWKQLLKKYDADNDGKFDQGEAAAFKSDLKDKKVPNADWIFNAALEKPTIPNETESDKKTKSQEEVASSKPE